MDKDLKKIISISTVVLLFGGFTALANMWSAVGQVFIAFFPFLAEAGEQALKDYLTSPYFIVGVIMAIASAFGIWFGRKGGKALWLIVSIICEIISLVSILSNIV